MDDKDEKAITIESPFGTLVTSAVKLARFAEQLAEIARRADSEADTAPLPFHVGGIRCVCHPNGG